MTILQFVATALASVIATLLAQRLMRSLGNAHTLAAEPQQPAGSTPANTEEKLIIFAMGSNKPIVIDLPNTLTD